MSVVSGVRAGMKKVKTTDSVRYICSSSRMYALHCYGRPDDVRFVDKVFLTLGNGIGVKLA